jgi:hypothetical protein
MPEDKPFDKMTKDEHIEAAQRAYRDLDTAVGALAANDLSNLIERHLSAAGVPLSEAVLDPKRVHERVDYNSEIQGRLVAAIGRERPEIEVVDIDGLLRMSGEGIEGTDR